MAEFLALRDQTTWLRRLNCRRLKLPMTIFFRNVLFKHVVFGCFDKRWWALWRCVIKLVVALASCLFPIYVKSIKRDLLSSTMRHDTKRRSRFCSMFNIREHLNLQRLYFASQHLSWIHVKWCAFVFRELIIEHRQL